MKHQNTSFFGRKTIFIACCSLAFGVANAQQSQTFSYTGSSQIFTVPSCVNTITVDALGAQGGYTGGNGAMIEGTFTVTPNTTYTVIVGQMGYSPSGNANNSGGGGGGSFVYNGNTLLVAAGGGGGRCGYSGAVSASSSGTISANGNATSGNGAQGGTGGQGGSAGPWGGGGAGWLSNGTPSPYGGYTAPGWAAGTGDCSGGGGGCGGVGGYGGGGGGGNAYGGGGGGGGYSGGGGGIDPQHGGGGGSYNGGLNQVNNTGYNVGNGSVAIYWNVGAGPLTFSANAINNVLCNGASNGKAQGIVSGGSSPYTYLWAPRGGSNATATGLSAGSFTVTLTDACGGTASASVNITEPNVLNVSASALTNVSCNGGADGNAVSNVVGGTSPYTYAWSNLQNGVDATGLSAGTYVIGILDANGCTATASVSITQPNVVSLAANVTANVLCNGGSNGSASSAASGGTGPYNYLWNNGGTTDTTTGLSAGAYTIGIIDANGCTATASVNITEPTALSASANTLTNVLCNKGTDGSGSSNVSGGTSPYTYAWSNLQNGANATGLSAGTYTVGISDGNGCTATSSISVTQPTAIGIITHSNPDNGQSTGSAWVSVSGGTGPYAYIWTPGGNTTDSIAQKDSGSYCCKVTDANGCMDSICINISSTLGVANIRSGSGEITIYPNPNNGQFTIQSSVVSGQQLVEVYNVLGEKVYSTPLTINSSPSTINISSQPNGVYLYRVISESGSLIGEGKIMVQK